MRVLCLLILIAIGAAVAIFVVQNDQSLTLSFLNQRITTSVAGVVGIAYGLGMLTGWTVVGMLRRSFETATDFRAYEQPARVR